MSDFDTEKTSFFSRTVAIPLLLFPVLTLILVSPRGEFSIIDDWVHMREVKTLLEHHRYEGGPPTVSTLVVQVLWGSFFCKIFGTSYTVLRYSTLTLGYIGIWVMARCALLCGASRSVALLAGALLWCVPYYMIFTYSFMTEVPFTAACVISGWFYLCALKRDEVRYIVVGTLFSLLAYLIRQHGILLAASMGATLVVLAVVERRRIYVRQLTVWGVCIVVLVVAALLWEKTRPYNPSQASWLRLIRSSLTLYQVKLVLHYAIIVMTFLGLYTFPVLIVRLWQLWRREVKWPLSRTIATVCVTTLGLLALQFTIDKLRYGPDVLHNLGTPVFYSIPSDMSPDDSKPPIQCPAALRFLLAVAGLLHASIIGGDIIGRLFPLWKGVRGGNANRMVLDVQTKQIVFLTAWLLAFVVSFTPFLPKIYWRYVLQMAPPAILLATLGLPAVISRTRFLATNVAVGVVYVVLVIALQDSMAWNTARWVAIDKLVNEMSVEPRDINGGWEFNFQYTMDEWNRLEESGVDLPDKGFYVVNDAYTVAFSPRKGHVEIGRVPYFSWVGFQERAIYILKRDSQAGN
jgi:hypothetical protein